MMVLYIVVGLLAALALIYLLVLVPPRLCRPKDDTHLCDYAHRGLHGDGVPENSLAAFSLACEAGVGIELDVHLSKDGKIVVFHDESLARMTGCDRRVGELSLDELKALSLGGTDQTIPTLDEVLALVDGRVPLLIELKGENTNTALCPSVAERMRAYRGAFCFESFNPLLVRAIKRCCPCVPAGLLYTNVCRDKNKRSVLNIALTVMALNVLARPDFVAYNAKDRTALPVCITTGLYRAPRFVWTLHGEAQVKQAHTLGECPIFEKQ